MKIKTTTLRLNNRSRVNRFYESFQSTEEETFVAVIQSEAPRLEEQIEKLEPEKKKEFEKNFNTAWTGISPDTRKMVLGGTAGGVLAGAGSAVALSVREISKLTSNPLVFSLGITAIGVVGGALAPRVLDYFSEAQAKGGRALSLEYSSPTWSRIAFGEVNVNLEVSSKEEKNKEKSEKVGK